MSRVAVLASGQGTTAEAFIRAGATGKIDAQVSLVIANNPDAGIFERVKNLNQEYGLAIKAVCINGKTHPTAAGENLVAGGQTEAEQAEILKLIKSERVDLVVLMGYMKRIGPKLVHELGWLQEYSSPYQAMMLNTHPGLLPDTKGSFGLPAQQLTLDKHLEHGGQTLHVVAEDYDDGPVVAEHKVPVQPNDTAEELFERVQQTEKENLPADVDAFIKNRQNYLQAKEGQ